MMKHLMLLLLFSQPLMGQEKPQGKNVRIEYKKYEEIDLGNLEVRGQIIAPGDLSVSERSRKKFTRNLFERYNFNPEVKKDIENLR